MRVSMRAMSRRRRLLFLGLAGAAISCDIVAIPRSGLAPHFTGVERDVDVVIGKNDFHTVASYLRCPEVAAVVSSP